MNIQSVKTPENMMFLITSLYGGGAEKVCCILASKMAECCNVTLCYMVEDEEGRRYPIDPRCEVVKLPFKHCTFKRNPLKFFWYKWTLIRFCKKLKKEKKIDVSVSLLIQPNLLNVFSRAGDRVITSERANPKMYMADKFWLTRLAYSKSDHVVFQSSKVQGFYDEKIRKKSSIIMNPVSVSCLADDVRNKRIISMGRLSEQKNHAMLIRSFAAFYKNHPDYTLTIYGEGDLRDSLQKLISELNLQDAAFLPGNSNNVHEQIRDAEIFVLSSNFEGLSNALLECMTMGISCISTRCEGSTDVIRDGENGLLIDIGDEDALTKSLNRLADDPEFRKNLEKQAMKDSVAFDKNIVIEQWEEVFRGERNK